MSNGSLSKPRKRAPQTVEAEAMRGELLYIAREPNPWQAANSRIAGALQEIALLRREARSAYYGHDEHKVALNYREIARLAKRVVALAEFLASERRS